MGLRHKEPAVAMGTVGRVPKLTREQLENQRDEIATMLKESQDGRDHLTAICEAFLEANRVALEVLGTTLPAVRDLTTRSRLGVVEDILSGANERYTDN